MFHCWWNLLCRSMMSGRKWRTWSKSCNNRCKTFLRPTLGSRFSGCMAMDVKNWWSFIRNLHEFANRYLGNTQTYSMLWWHELCSLGCFAGSWRWCVNDESDVFVGNLRNMLPISSNIYRTWSSQVWFHPFVFQEEGVSRALRNIFGNTKKVSGFKLKVCKKKLCYCLFF